jgi:hypothetical protein
MYSWYSTVSHLTVVSLELAEDEGLILLKSKGLVNQRNMSHYTGTNHIVPGDDLIILVTVLVGPDIKRSREGKATYRLPFGDFPFRRYVIVLSKSKIFFPVEGQRRNATTPTGSTGRRDGYWPVVVSVVRVPI